MGYTVRALDAAKKKKRLAGSNFGSIGRCSLVNKLLSALRLALARAICWSALGLVRPFWLLDLPESWVAGARG